MTENNYSDIFPPIGTATLSKMDPLIKKYGLPLHVIFKDKIREQANSFNSIANKHYPDTMICFAVKSNPCMGAVRAMKDLELGIDAVSINELDAALEVGIPTNKIVCNGNAKGDEYLHRCISNNVLIAVDGQEELDNIERIAATLKTRARALLRISHMPLEGLTSSDQSTASAWTKFGFPYDEVEDILQSGKSLPWVEFYGFSAHIGTQICELKGYVKLMNHLLKLIEVASNLGMSTRYIDIGGGFPISYISKADWELFQRRLINQLSGNSDESESVSWNNVAMGFAHLHGEDKIKASDWQGKAYWSPHPSSRMLEALLISKSDNGSDIHQRLKDMGSPTLIVEPGRSLIGAAGITLTEVISVKKVLGNWVIMLDLGIVNHGTNLISPDIYPVKVLPEVSSDEPVEAFLGGRLCFTGDMISKVKIKLNRLPKRGEIVAIYHTGAYCADHFASNSCGYPLPAKIAIDNQNEVEIWRPRQEFADVFK